MWQRWRWHATFGGGTASRQFWSPVLWATFSALEDKDCIMKFTNSLSCHFNLTQPSRLRDQESHYGRPTKGKPG